MEARLVTVTTYKPETGHEYKVYEMRVTRRDGAPEKIRFTSTGEIQNIEVLGLTSIKELEDLISEIRECLECSR